MENILEYLLDLYGFDHKFIRQVASGERYFAVELVNGNIGVCATLGEKLPQQVPDQIEPAFYHHRIILTAYYNALLNYRSQNIEQDKDITDINLKKYRNIHFVGRFTPIFEKLKINGINFTYSDLRSINAPDNKISNQKEYLSRADCVIITATTIPNNTFNTIVEASPNADKYLLGPSSLLIPDLKQWGIKASFGSLFKLYDSRVLGTIAQNYGTRYFLHRGKKVMLVCDTTNDQ